MKSVLGCDGLRIERVAKKTELLCPRGAAPPPTHTHLYLCLYLPHPKLAMWAPIRV